MSDSPEQIPEEVPEEISEETAEQPAADVPVEVPQEVYEEVPGEVVSEPAKAVPEPRLLEPSRIDPMTEQNQPDTGTRMFVLFFFLIVPPLGVVLLVAIGWSLWKAFNTASL
jgi:hypothetical protein